MRCPIYIQYYQSNLFHLVLLKANPLICNYLGAHQITTTFSGAVATAAAQPAAAQALLAFMASPQAAPAKRRQGMEPA